MSPPSAGWTDVMELVLRMGAAYILALPVGWEWEHSARRLGLRTFPLVALAACAYLLLGQHAFGDSQDAQARVLQGLLTGIGFIGGGAILKGPQEVHGVATAASIWNTAAIGAAAAYGDFALAVILTVANILTLRLLGRLQREQPPGNGGSA